MDRREVEQAVQRVREQYATGTIEADVANMLISCVNNLLAHASQEADNE